MAISPLADVECTVNGLGDACMGISGEHCARMNPSTRACSGETLVVPAALKATRTRARTLRVSLWLHTYTVTATYRLSGLRQYIAPAPLRVESPPYARAPEVMLLDQWTKERSAPLRGTFYYA